MLHFTFDEYEATLEKMLENIKQELKYTKEDNQYYDKQTKTEMKAIRKHLRLSLKEVKKMMKRIYNSH